MKNRYKVTLLVANREFLADIVDAVENKVSSIDIEVDAPTPAPPKQEPIPVIRKPRKVRAKRTSKVHTAILGAMGNGPASTKAMKEALERAGLAASSLPGGLAVLTRSGQIERLGDGMYGLKLARAAE